jgi:hypothetical protein
MLCMTSKLDILHAFAGMHLSTCDVLQVLFLLPVLHHAVLLLGSAVS